MCECSRCGTAETTPEPMNQIIMSEVTPTRMATQTTNAESHIEPNPLQPCAPLSIAASTTCASKPSPFQPSARENCWSRIATCGICGTDLKKIHTGSHSAPRIFGHEMSGTIVAVGEGVTRFRGGERVVVHHHVPCGECYYCRKGTPAQCPLYKKVGVTAGFEPSGGGFAEYIRVMDWVAASGGVVPHSRRCSV